MGEDHGLDVQQEARLREAYARPPRAYHNFGHVEEVMRHVDAVADGPGWRQPREVRLAVLYHDAIYEPSRHDNEARSAAFARAEIGAAMSREDVDVERVAWLIELTARHGQFGPADFADDAHPGDVRHFLDCDMAILGAAPDAFDAYDRGIASEYRGHVPGWLFRINRRRFLKGLLAKERIFLSDFFHERLDARARANLRRAVTGKR
ncbi:HD domain-containing protein [Marilutibacter aestuarii]|uniref:Metal-dependent HD superfamily phosphohydrolase n=1 Tax=Marilutibacter aestuarii TaxID=1706195 RepID=A0A508AGP5_9GAMM|nr:hypothetical protein [Lysobacter aestuarii]TQD47604.1 hypothetical protein FKV25_05805 [Lysobacter aestuarii]